MCRALTIAVIVLATHEVLAQPAPAGPATAEPVTLEYLEKAKAEYLSGQGPDSITLLRRLNADPKATAKASVALLSRDAAQESQTGPLDPQTRLSMLYSSLIVSLGQSGDESAVPVLVNCMATRNAAMKHLAPACAQAIVNVSNRVEIRKEQLDPVLNSKDADVARLAEQAWKYIQYEGIREDPATKLGMYRQSLATLEKQLGKAEDWKKTAESRGITIPSTNAGPAIRAFIKSCETERRKPPALTRVGDAPFDAEAFVKRNSALLYVELQAMDELAKCGLDESFDCFVGLLASAEDNALSQEGPVTWAAVDHLYRMTGQYFPMQGALTYMNFPMPVDLSKKAVAAWRKWRAQAGKAVAKPDPAALAREDRLGAFRMTQLKGTEGEFARPADDVIDELLREDNRRIIEMLVEVLRARTLTEAQVAKVIQAAEKEPSSAKRVYLWQVLFDAQSGAASKSLEKVFQGTADEGQVAQFIGALRTFRAGDVPLITHIYTNCTSPVIQDAIVDFACRVGSTDGDMRLEMQRTPADTDAFRNTRIALLRWLIRNGRTEEQKLRALSGLYPGRNSVGVGVGQNTASEAVTEFLETAKSPGVRRRVYEMVMSKYGSEYWLGTLLSGEGEETQHAALIAFRGYVEKQKAFSGYANQPAVPLLRDALSRDLTPKVKQDIEGILTMIRRAAVNAVIASYQTRATQTWDPRQGRQFLDQMARGFDRDMPIEPEIGQLKAQFGALPEEAELRTTLERLREERRENLKKLIDQASTQGAEPPSPARQ